MNNTSMLYCTTTTFEGIKDQQSYTTRRGEYRLHPAFKELEVSHLDRFAFDEVTRSKHFKSSVTVHTSKWKGLVIKMYKFSKVAK